MFGVSAGNEERNAYFTGLARRFASDAKMFRCRAAVHVENKDDIVFWSAVLKHFCPGDRFHFLAGSRNEFGHETSGVTQCLKYFHTLGPDFFICIDSDYRYLLHEKGINAEHFILQTYTYSFENHHCYAEGLDDVCGRITRVPNRVFDFKRFLTDFSRIVYGLFIWHLYFLRTDPGCFTKYDFNQYINMTSRKFPISVGDNGRRALEELEMKVKRREIYFSRKYPEVDLGFLQERYARMGLLPETAYLFLRGHNVYDMVTCLCREVCGVLLKGEKRKRRTRNAIAALYKNTRDIDVQLKRNISYGKYPAIRKLEEDIRKLLGIPARPNIGTRI